MNNEDMLELFSKFKSMVSEGNIPDEMKNILSSLSEANSNNQAETSQGAQAENAQSKQNDGMRRYKQHKSRYAINRL